MKGLEDTKITIEDIERIIHNVNEMDVAIIFEALELVTILKPEVATRI